MIKASSFQLGDPTISILELWGAEYQESNAILVNKQDRPLVEKIGSREKCCVSFVGSITGDGKVSGETGTFIIKTYNKVLFIWKYLC